MISQSVAEYVANVRYKTDLGSLRRARKFINILEKQMSSNTQRAVKQGIENNMKFDSRKISRQLQASFNKSPIRIRITGRNIDVDAASIKAKLMSAFIGRGTQGIKIDKFSVDQAALHRTLTRAFNKTYRVSVKPVLGSGGDDVSGARSRRGYGGFRGLDRFNRRVDSFRPTGSMMLAGGAVTGGYGLMRLNDQVREWNMLETKFASITGSKGTAREKMASLDRLGSLVGASPLELANQYTQMLATVQGTALEPQFDAGFTSFTKYGKVMGLDDEAMKGSFRAVTQMISKDQIMAEELRNQLAERLPAAVRLMADAVAGGDTRLLGKMMERGELKPSEVLPKFFALMEERAQQGWGTYQQSIAYQQGQAGYQFSNLIKAFTFNGGEQGFVNMWKMVQQSLKEMLPLAKRLGESFFDISKNFENITNLIRLASKLMAEEGDIFAPWTKSLLNFAALVSSKFYRIFYVMDKIMMFAEDFMAYKAGESSHIGDVLNGGGGWIGVLVSGLEQAGWATLIFAGIIAKLGYTILKMTGVLWAAEKLLDGGSKGGKPTGKPSVMSKVGSAGKNLLKSPAGKTTLGFLGKTAGLAGMAYTIYDEGSRVLAPTNFNDPSWDKYRQTRTEERSLPSASFSTETLNFMNSMAGFQGMSPNLQNPSKVANMNGKGVTQVIENLNVNIDGSNQPPELLARAIRQEADRMSFNQLQLTPNAY